MKFLGTPQGENNPDNVVLLSDHSTTESPGKTTRNVSRAGETVGSLVCTQSHPAWGATQWQHNQTHMENAGADSRLAPDTMHTE